MTEELSLLRSAAYKITDLKRQNEIMSARLEMFDNMMSLLHTMPASRGQGMEPDLVYQIEKYIASMPKE
jgi:hypothetical protein